MVSWNKLLKFLETVGKLKEIPRSGWKFKVGIEKPESVADHSFRTAVLAMLYADLKGLDAEKMMRMALLHDAQEAIIGDLMPEEKRCLQAEEYDAAVKLFSYLPKRLREKYTSIWEEFDSWNSEEAVVLNKLDKLEMVLQALEYRKKGYSRMALQEFLLNLEELEASEDPYLKSMYRLLKKRCLPP